MSATGGAGEEKIVPPVGKIALDRGLVTPAQLDAALAEQDRARSAGQPVRPLGQIFVAQGILTPPQLVEILEAAKTKAATPPAPLRRRSEETPPAEEAPAKPAPKTRRAGRMEPKPFGKYTLVAEIGRGGKGVVYEALDTVLNRKVALKMVHGEYVPDPKELEAEGHRFLTEARISANLPRHPNIVAVYEAGEIDGKRYLSMELIEGQPLLRWRKTATLDAHARLLHRVALALDHAHAHGVIHRDIKPQNILVDAAGEPHLTDWGLAKMVGQKEDLALALGGRVWGTPSHMSPEHARGLPNVDHRTDVWSLGVLLYEAVAGRPPFKAETPSQLMDKVVHEAVPPIGKFLDPSAMTPLQKGLEPAALRALAKDPEKRTPTASAFAGEIAARLEGGKKRKKLILLAAAGAAAAAVLVLLTVLLLGGPGLEEEFRRADQLFAQGDYQRALGVFDTILRDEPGNARAQAGRQASQNRLSELNETAKRKAADDARREANEQNKANTDELKRQMEAKRRADEEEALRLKMEQARLESERKEADQRARAAEEAKRKAEEQLKQPQPLPAVVPPPANPVPPPANPVPSPNPAPNPAVAPATPPAPTGEPRPLEGGVLAFEAEDFSGGAAPVAGTDYHDLTPGNSARAYRTTADVDIGAIQGGGGFFVGDIAVGEWLHYKFAGGGRFQVEIRYMNRRDATVHLEIDGTSATGPVTLPGFDRNQWTTATAVTVSLPAGEHDLRFVFDAPIQGLDWFRLKPFTPLPVPDAARVKEAEKTLREAFKADFAKRAPADQAALGKKLLAEGQKAQDDPVGRFTLLSEARDLAAQGGDATTALAAIDELDRTFALDAWPMRAEALGAAARAVKTPDAARAVAMAHLPVIEAAVDRDEFDLALSLSSKAESAAKASQSGSLASRVQSRTKEIQSLANEFRSLKAALKTLEEKPGDPAASYSVGAYRCFSKGDWSKGLPLLAKGSDAPLAALAQKESPPPADAVAQAALADAWREAGEKRTGTLKARVLGRALHWYERALPGLTAFARLKVEGHLDVLYKAVFGPDLLKRGLAFWVEPGHNPQDPFREIGSGVKYTNNQVTASDQGTKALVFARGWVDYPATEAVKSIEEAGSIFVWLRADSYVNQMGGLVNRGEQEKRIDDFALWVDRGSPQLWFNVGDNRSRFRAKGTLAPGAWTLAGVTWDDSAVTFSIDGREDSAFPNPPSLPARKAARISLGSDPPNGHEYFQGQIGSVMIYNRSLTAQETAVLYYGTRARFR